MILLWCILEVNIALPLTSEGNIKLIILRQTLHNLGDVRTPIRSISDVQIFAYDHILRMPPGRPLDLRKWSRRIRHVSDVMASERRPLDIMCYVGKTQRIFYKSICVMLQLSSNILS